MNILIYLAVFVYTIILSKTIGRSTSTDSPQTSKNVSGLPVVITMGAIICILVIFCGINPFITIYFYKKCKFLSTKLSIKAHKCSCVLYNYYTYQLFKLISINPVKQRKNK